VRRAAWHLAVFLWGAFVGYAVAIALWGSRPWS
jgi:hypothetical protein